MQLYAEKSPILVWKMPDMLNTNEADWRNAERDDSTVLIWRKKRTFSVVIFFGNINSFRHRQFPLFFKCTYIFSSELKVNDACRLNIHKRSCRQKKCTNSFTVFTVEFDRSKFLVLIDFLISSNYITIFLDILNHKFSILGPWDVHRVYTLH